MASRSVFMSACGDVMIASLAIKLWKKYWYDEVDKFYICYNNHVGAPLSVSQEFIAKAISDKKVHLIYHPSGIGNGMPITEMTLIAKEDLVMLLEDDGFIFTPGIVHKQFQKIESDLADAVGSARGSCGQEIWDASQKRYNLDYSAYGDVGPNCWPNFFFCKRADLLKTDLNFGSKSFLPGEYSKELDYTFKNVNHGDTFVWGCMQLRHLGVRIANVPQYHAMPSEIEDYEKKEANWRDGKKPYWMHGGSLSAGLNGYLSGQIPDTSTLSAKTEMESRVAWWTIALENTEGYEEFRKVYQSGIENLIQGAALERTRIQKKINIYNSLL